MIKSRIIIAFAAMLLTALCLCSCKGKTLPAQTATDANAATATDAADAATETDAAPADAATPTNAEKTIQAQRIGEGANSFFLTVTFADGSMKAYNVSTDETTIGAALLSLGLIEGEQGDYGLMVTTIDGVRADYTLDGAYWAFYVNGEYAMTGVDATEIAVGNSYHFTYTPADQ